MSQHKKLTAIWFAALIMSLLFSACLPALDPLNAQPESINAPADVAEISPTKEAVVDKEAFILHMENTSAGDPYIPEIGNQGYDVQQYDVKISLDPGTYWLDATVDIAMISVQDQLRQVSLDLIGFDVSEVLINQMPAHYFRLNNKLYIDLDQPAANGESLEVTIHYAGEPVQEASAYVPFLENLGIQFRENMLYIVSEPDGTRYWMPVNDHPRDKASYEMQITVPQPYIAVSNGNLLETITDGDQTSYIWENKEPLASALVTIAVGEYTLVESQSPQGIILRNYVTRESADDFAAMQPKIGEMIDWMSDLFGTYPYSEFGYVEVSDIGASLETQSMVIMSEGALFDEGVLCHEMSHMWFGDWVNLNSWAEIWRNEGFATYVSLMWEYRDNHDELDEYMAGIALSLEGEPSDFPLNNPPAEEMFGRDSYYKGAVLVHDLRMLMGDDAFFNGLRTYFIQYGGTDASQDEFQAVMEEAAGIPLDDFFADLFE